MSDSDVMFCLQSNQGLKSIDHLCIYPIRRIGLNTSDVSIRISSSEVYKLMYNLTIGNKLRSHCHSWLAAQ